MKMSNQISVLQHAGYAGQSRTYAEVISLTADFIDKMSSLIVSEAK